MAMKHRRCIVIFFRSPPSSSNVWRGVNPTTNSNGFGRRRGGGGEGDDDDDVPLRLLDGLLVEEIDISKPSQHQYFQGQMMYAPAWISLQNNLEQNRNNRQCTTICAMTGLAVDVEHLYRVLQQDQALNHIMPTTTLIYTKTLASILQQKCLRPNERPYGVQAMVVGCDGVSETVRSDSSTDDDDGDVRGDNDDDNGLCIYSMDPSGSWQSWSKGTAIGRFGPELRYLLGKKMRQQESAYGADASLRPGDDGLEYAVNTLIEVWEEICRQESIEPDKKEYRVLVVRRSRNRRSRNS